ncbi:hypothetical protein JQM68_12170 [Oscillibacter valericigenes]|uniref:hypothetical protein n=1 Tax=Oscillibacter valericigenes TaxID=351091 RepID=UPI001F16B270|nr:hypothetical protein [Oscillibacter valericigenes]MCF2617941.1 hypothetical protein [Oscillibacter valericigenes]
MTARKKKTSPDKAHVSSTQIQWPGKFIRISRFFFQTAVILFLICFGVLFDRLFLNSFCKDLVIRLADVLHNASPIWYICPALSRLDALITVFRGLHRLAEIWCVCFVPDSVLSEIFILFGIVNFSYPYVSGARDKLLYGIHLSDVIYAEFPWHNMAYGLYGLLVLTGLYCSEQEYLLLSATCLLGALFAFFSTVVIAFLFTASRTAAQDMVEYYLCRPNLPSRAFGKRKAANRPVQKSSVQFMAAAADYIREYYQDTRSIPEEVVRCTWGRLRFNLTETGLPVIDPAGSSGSSVQMPDSGFQAPLEDIYKTAEQITQMRSTWEHMLRGLAKGERPDLICRVLHVIAKALPGYPDEQLLFSRKTSRISSEQLCLGLPLCGLLVCLRAQDSSWMDCMGLLYQISNPRVNREDTAYNSAIQLFFLLTATLLTVEIAAGDTVDENIWPKVTGLSKSLHVSLSWIPRFLSWGQSMAISYTDDWYDTLLSLATHEIYGWLREMLSELNDYE